jgi:hypothetical protein
MMCWKPASIAGFLVTGSIAAAVLSLVGLPELSR